MKKLTSTITEAAITQICNLSTKSYVTAAGYSIRRDCLYYIISNFNQVRWRCVQLSGHSDIVNKK